MRVGWSTSATKGVPPKPLSHWLMSWKQPSGDGKGAFLCRLWSCRVPPAQTPLLTKPNSDPLTQEKWHRVSAVSQRVARKGGLAGPKDGLRMPGVRGITLLLRERWVGSLAAGTRVFGAAAFSF